MHPRGGYGRLELPDSRLGHPELPHRSLRSIWSERNSDDHTSGERRFGNRPERCRRHTVGCGGGARQRWICGRCGHTGGEQLPDWPGAVPDTSGGQQRPARRANRARCIKRSGAGGLSGRRGHRQHRCKHAIVRGRLHRRGNSDLFQFSARRYGDRPNATGRYPARTVADKPGQPHGVGRERAILVPRAARSPPPAYPLRSRRRTPTWTVSQWRCRP